MTGAQLLLGVDTGGTYTDAVLVDEARMAEGPEAVLTKAKALTTRDDLARGVGEAIAAVMSEGAATAGAIGMVALSTTLATNALVEGQGGRVALVMIGFDPRDLERHGLAESLGSDPLIQLPGGHDAMGAEAAALDFSALEEALGTVNAGGFAICGHFAVRNPAHELAVRDLIRQRTDLPVTCSHELSAQVGGPKRALTALLNARLIGMIDRLIAGVEGLLAERGITAPLMVVRGDGSLVSASFARQRPIETILSGPAASLVGAGWLTGARDAVISDIGGTTTDIAVLTDGRPKIDPAGAEVGGMRTMVEAVAMRTHGLGGDSEVGLAERGLSASLTLGPRRVIPTSLLAVTHGDLVRETLTRQIDSGRVGDLDGTFYITLRPANEGLGEADAALLARLAEGPLPADRLIRGRMDRMAVKRLVTRGLIGRAGLTPSDASHVLGLHAGWDREAAELACALFARRRGNDGRQVAADGAAVAKAIIEQLTRRSAELVLEATLAEDGFEGRDLSRSVFARAALDGHRGLTVPKLSLSVPLVGLGASAPTYYPAVARLLEAESMVPDHADVANAVGAVVGGVRLSQSGTVSQPREGVFRAHLPAGPKDFTEQADAEAALTSALGDSVRAAAGEAGAAEVELGHTIDRQEAEIEGRYMLIEATITVTASGRPRRAIDIVAQNLPKGFAGI
ncbi:hydantoinase/oxoprolinase family protein [Rhodobacteraceae bacterium NNCM2]|nr:hydantoinase/oxoprolinase family protein [Coraliihabitans acroporae]